MDMKEICREFIDLLGDKISDSLYDDEGDDYVELYINGYDGSVCAEIEIDREYFGFTCGNYDETYGYDDLSRENAAAAAEKIRKILSGELCVLTLFPEGNYLSCSFLAETDSVSPEYLSGFLSEAGLENSSGRAEIWYPDVPRSENYSFSSGKIL